MGNRTTRVARTAPGLSHVNRVRLASFGVKEVRLKTQDGKKQSISNTSKGASPGSGGVFNFAPGRKGDNTPVDPVQIVYELHNPTGAVQIAKLELFWGKEKTPVWTLELHPEQFTHGRHTVAWDGSLMSDIELLHEDNAQQKYEHQFKGSPAGTKLLPDGYITAARSSYRLQITLYADAPGDPPFGWTDFQIAIHSIELELGWKDTLKEERDKLIWGDMCGHKDTPAGRKAALPAEDDGVPKRIFLTSNIFKDKPGDMMNNTLFFEYLLAWQEGPHIPVFAKVHIKNSRDAAETEEGAAVALGGVKFLWDWEAAVEDTEPIVRKTPRTYVERALDYDSGKRLPVAGDNCNVDRGGKRTGRPGAGRYPHLFPEQKGEDPKSDHTAGEFPFKVTYCRPDHRCWAALSEAWTTGKLGGMTGVMFNPSRMAGDTYRVLCYLANDIGDDGYPLLDTSDDTISAPVKASTGMLQIWRKIYMSRYVRKTHRIGDMFARDDFKEVQEVYRQAFVEIEALPDMLKSFISRERYHELAIDALRLAFNAPDDGDVETPDDARENDPDDAAETPVKRDLFEFVVGKNHQYDGTGTAGKPSGSAFTYNEWEDMKKAATDWFYTRRRKQHPEEPDSASHVLAAVAREKWADDRWGWPIGYGQDMMHKSLPIIQTVVDQIPVLVDVPDGITIVEFDHLQNLDSPLDEIYGCAFDTTGHTRSKCAYLAFAPTADTMAHEIGHHMMCPHAPGGEKPAEELAPDLHDKDDDQCLMSYNLKAVTFCGKCLLRLRGWDASALDTDGTKNQR
jgi:hypothetical protein